MEVTDEAMSVAQGIFAPIGATMREAIATYSPDEQATVLRFLLDAVDAAARALEEGGGSRSGMG